MSIVPHPGPPPPAGRSASRPDRDDAVHEYLFWCQCCAPSERVNELFRVAAFWGLTPSQLLTYVVQAALAVGRTG
jgi:hypothetical protein